MKMAASSWMLALCWLCVTLCHEFTSAKPTQSVEYVEGTVYIDQTSGKVTYKLGVVDKQHGAAYGFCNNTLNTTGWSILEITASNTQLTNTDIMYAAGFLEGLLTARQIWQNYVNLRKEFFGKTNVSKIQEFYAQQDKWTRSMIQSHPADEDAFWRHVSYIMAMFDGLYDGYKTAAQPDWDTDLFVIQYLNGIGDFIDLRHAVDPSTRPNFHHMSTAQFRSYIASSGHCSALVKMTAGFENLFMSHSSWFIYASMMRIYKHYHFNVVDKDTSAFSLSFSSYPGFLVSLDDFYLLDSKLVILQTTNNVFNVSLYDFVRPQSLFAWQRMRVTNMLATDGQMWFKTFAKYNSGTYNNQYMIIDLKSVSLGNSLADGSLWVVEQIPGLVVGQDQTQILRTGYWPSYNVPFYEIIYNMSGYPAVVEQHGPDYSYQLAPRAKIFRRDQSSVVDLQTMKDIMRYNDYKHDNYSGGDACHTICCRGDISSGAASPFGCYDTKVSDYKMAVSLRSEIINGPTTSHSLPVFSWTAPAFHNYSHVGLPDSYNFPWVITSPVL